MNAYVLDYAEKAVAAASEKALKLGEARGEEKKARAIAVTMHKLGMSLDTIAKCVGNDKATIEEWLKKANG